MPENRPHITVATVVERSGQLLMVQEQADGHLVYNQPAGHLEPGETLLAAAVRETLEETAWEVEVTALLGIYAYTSTTNRISYVRHCFIATPLRERNDRQLDKDIVAALWLSPVEIEQRRQALRSPLVYAAVQDYLRGVRHPLDLISEF
jgi:ADP-ribose pyrophosphatase YjhB (NUDIX family)